MILCKWCLRCQLMPVMMMMMMMMVMMMMILRDDTMIPQSGLLFYSHGMSSTCTLHYILIACLRSLTSPQLPCSQQVGHSGRPCCREVEPLRCPHDQETRGRDGGKGRRRGFGNEQHRSHEGSDCCFYWNNYSINDYYTFSYYITYYYYYYYYYYTFGGIILIHLFSRMLT